MAYRLSEILMPKYVSNITDTNRLYMPIHTLYKTNKINKSLARNKRLIVEYQSVTNSGISLSSTSADETYNSTEQTSIYNYQDIRLTPCGYKVGCSAEWTNSAINNTDSFYHCIFDFQHNYIQMYNAITKQLYVSMSISGFIARYPVNDVYISFYYGSYGNTPTVTINPDVESFKYPPCVEHDTDLYSAILDLPYTQLEINNSNKKNNIISIL